MIQNLSEVFDGRSLIYDVSKQQGQFLDSINLLSIERPESQTLPAAIITDWKDIIQPRSTEEVSYVLFSDNLYSKKKSNLSGISLGGLTYDACHVSSYSNSCSDLLRDYQMVSLMNFPSRVAPTRDEERLVFRDRDKTIRCQKERELRDWETQATRREYTRATVEYNELLCEHEQRVDELAQQLSDSGDHNGEGEAEAEARLKLSTEAPVRMKSYLNDPMMVLLVRKGP